MRNTPFQMGGKEAMFDAIAKSFPAQRQMNTREITKGTEKPKLGQTPTPIPASAPDLPTNLPMSDKQYTELYEDIKPELEQLRSDEGFRTKVYKDTQGFLTVGTGHKLTPKELLKYKEGDELDQDDLEEILQEDYQTARKGAERLAPKNAPDEVKNILTNMVFQMGETGVGKFTNMKAALDEGDYKKASTEMLDSLWAKQTPERANRLAKRMAELSLLAENKE